MRQMRTVYLNGEYLPENEAKVSIFDRGFLMADGVYEVTSVLDGKLVDFDGHAVRLERSLTELGMKNPISKEDLLAVHRELVSLNDVVEGGVYLQITRGAPAVDFVSILLEQHVVRVGVEREAGVGLGVFVGAIEHGFWR